MNLIIGDEVANPHTPNSYEVVIATFQGDADGNEYLILGPFIKDQDEASLENLLTVIDRVSKAFPLGMGGRDNFDKVEGFLAWFSDEELDEEEFRRATSGMSYDDYLATSAFSENYRTFWPLDATTDYESPNSYDSFTVFYYDENKAKHTVTVA